ncbi:hypothetical protein KIMH_04570 [Bombiscardovia apis]|uniref:Aminoglycoside phosphotransferase domain-containing protein n=2 Tax=Bombiscardovia apis TaxID=2932182 RepID=A0ABN6SGG6_9BIFI|nr:hypothetical protein KIMH_04570 [Bombiscardovia apis]
MPDAYFTGARASDQASAQDEGMGIDCAIVQNASGRLYDVWATSTPKGKKRLSKRVKAAEALEDVRGMAALGFHIEQVLSYQPGTDPKGPTGDVAVAIMTHTPGHAQSLKLLTNEECSAVGTAIGAIHRVDPRGLRERFYPAFSTTEIANQLKSWIANLKHTGHVPREITDSWSRIIRTEGLWSFNTRMVHGGFADGDFLFTGSGLSAVHNWQNMQVNDPARDLAWIFAKLDQSGRDAVIAAYGRIMGSQLDDLIMLRANLWLQMEQVGDFVLALEHADNEKIIRFKAQVERLAQQLNDRVPKSYAPSAGAAANRPKPNQTGSMQDAPPVIPDDSPTTVTVGVLLREDAKRAQAARKQQANAGQPPAPAPAPAAAQVEEDATAVRPAYRKDQEQPAAGLTTGRHAAVRPPTLPDMIASHTSDSGQSVPPEVEFDEDAPRNPGRHSKAGQESAKIEQVVPKTSETMAIDRVSMTNLAQEQTQESHQSSLAHSETLKPAPMGLSGNDSDDEAQSISFSWSATPGVKETQDASGSDSPADAEQESNSSMDLFAASAQFERNHSEDSPEEAEDDANERSKSTAKSDQGKAKQFSSRADTDAQTVIISRSGPSPESTPTEMVQPDHPGANTEGPSSSTRLKGTQADS